MVGENEVFWGRLLSPIHCKYQGRLDKCTDGTGLSCCFYCPDRKKCITKKDSKTHRYERCPCRKRGRNTWEICLKYLDYLNGGLNDKKP